MSAGNGSEPPSLFADEELSHWKAEWQNMPEYSHELLKPKFQIIVNFATAADVDAFFTAIGSDATLNRHPRQLQYLWFPDQDNVAAVNLRYMHVSREWFRAW